MTKQICLFIISFVIIQTASAQVDYNSPIKRFGIRAGVNFSHMDFSKGVPPSPTETSWGSGVHFGFIMTLPVSDRLSFQPEYLFSQMKGNVKNSDTAYKLDYLSLPLFLKFEIHEKLFLMAGPQIDVLINAKRTTGNSTTKTTHDTEERSLGITAGFDYQLTESLSVTARYMHGFNHIGIGQRSDVQEFKFKMLQLSTCIRF